MEKEAKIEAMWKAEIEHARAQLGEIVSPFEEVFRNLRNRFADDAAEMLESIQKNGFVRGKVAEKGRGLVELFDMWAVHNDVELRAKLIDLKKAIGPSVKDRADASERSTEEVKIHPGRHRGVGAQGRGRPAAGAVPLLFHRVASNSQSQGRGNPARLFGLSLNFSPSQGLT
jgi:hypothetical protein